MTPLPLALGGLLLSLATWGVYMATIPMNRVPVRATATLAAQAAAGLLGLAGLALWALEGRPGWGPPLLALGALSQAAGFLWVYSQRRTPVGELRVAVGDRLLPFTARTADGQPFESESLAGQRVLLKFFRGGW